MKQISSNQDLNTSASYLSAIKDAEKIEQAIALVEQGESIVDFPRYVNAFTALVQRVDARTERGGINPHLRKTHRELEEKLQNLSHRVETACRKASIAPAANESSRNNVLYKIPSVLLDNLGKWDWKRKAKYGLIGGGAVLAVAYGHKGLWNAAATTANTIYSFITSLPGFFYQGSEFTEGVAEAWGIIVNRTGVINKNLPEGSAKAIGKFTGYYLPLRFAWDFFEAVSKRSSLLPTTIGVFAADYACSQNPEACEKAVKFTKDNPGVVIGAISSLGAIGSAALNHFSDVLVPPPQPVANEMARWTNEVRNFAQLRFTNVPDQDYAYRKIITRDGLGKKQKFQAAFDEYNTQYPARANRPLVTLMTGGAAYIAPKIFGCAVDPKCREAVHNFTATDREASAILAASSGIASLLAAHKTKEVVLTAFAAGLMLDAMIAGAAGTVLTLSGGVAALVLGGYSLYNSWNDGYIADAVRTLKPFMGNSTINFFQNSTNIYLNSTETKS